MSLRIESTSSDNSQNLIREFLASRKSGVLATADGAGNPHAAVVYYVLEDDFTMLFATSRETQKQKNMEENGQVAFVVYDEQKLTTVQITGNTTTVEDSDAVLRTINNMFASTSEELPPAAQLLSGGYVAHRLVPTVIKMGVYRSNGEDKEDIYETLLFSEQT